MEEDDRPRSRSDAASQLASESLDSYSRAELDVRVVLLEAEIARVKTHRAKADTHMLAAEDLFRTKPS